MSSPCLCHQLRHQIDGFIHDKDLIRLVQDLSSIIRRSGSRTASAERVIATMQAAEDVARATESSIDNAIARLMSRDGPINLYFFPHGSGFRRETPWGYIMWAAVRGLEQAGLDTTSAAVCDEVSRHIETCSTADGLTRRVARLASLISGEPRHMRQQPEILPARHNATTLLQSIRDQQHA